MEPLPQSELLASHRVSRQHHLEAFNRTQSNVMGDGVLTVDRDGRIQLSDRVIRQIFDIYPGHHIADSFPELWREIGRVIRFEVDLCQLPVDKDGESFQVNVSPIVHEQQLLGAICVFADKSDLGVISRKMRAYKALSSELSEIVDSCFEGLWICDGNADVIRINPASARINNVNADDVIGRNMVDLVREGIIDRSATLEVLEKKETVNFLRTTNEGRLVLNAGTPIFSDDGSISKVVVSERDITEIDEMQRRLEEQSALNSHFQSQLLELKQAEMASTTIIAKSPSMVRALNQALKVSQADSSVLVLGESGVGKGLFADLIHQHSRRSDKPLIKINCGAIPETLIESELFGHEKGAFTGAQTAKPGHIEMAHGGILFLDEIAELPLASQVKLLRFLEDGEVTRLGATKSRMVDVRIIAATHANLEQMVEDKLFRLDLYYRLNVIPLHIPALRERRDCILPLLQHYIEQFSRKNGMKKRLTNAAMETLLSYDWPGNVRQLMNICERMLVMSDGELIDIPDLPQNLVKAVPQEPLNGKRLTLQQAMDSYERAILMDAMKEHGNQYRVASALGVNQSTVARKLRRHGLRPR